MFFNQVLEKKKNTWGHDSYPHPARTRGRRETINIKPVFNIVTKYPIVTVFFVLSILLEIWFQQFWFYSIKLKSKRCESRLTTECPKYTKAHFCMSQPQYHTYTMANYAYASAHGKYKEVTLILKLKVAADDWYRGLKSKLKQMCRHLIDMMLSCCFLSLPPHFFVQIQVLDIDIDIILILILILLLV